MGRRLSIVIGILAAASVVIHAQAGLSGKWQGTTASGRPIVLDAKVNGQKLTGTFTLAQQTATITDGKVAEKTFSFTATVQDRTTTFTGELVGDEVKLTVEGVSGPLTLKRAK